MVERCKVETEDSPMNKTDIEDVVEFEDLSSEDKELSDKVGFLIEGVLIPILATLGIVGKSMNTWLDIHELSNTSK